MPRELMRFPLTAADQARVDTATVVSEHQPGDPNLLRLAFSLADPTQPAPAVVPPFAGSVYFVADRTNGTGSTPTVDAAGVLDPPDAVDWLRTGTLLVAADRSTSSGFVDHATDLAIAPDLAWVGPIELPESFFVALADPAVMSRSTIVTDDATIRSGDATWPAHATAAFLAGSLGLRFTHDADDSAQDTIARLIAADQAPLAQGDGGSGFTIDVRFAAHAGPLDLSDAAAVPPFVADDGLHEELAGPAHLMTQADPFHPSNGQIPARYVFELLRSEVLDGSNTDPVASLVLSDQTMWTPVRLSLYSLGLGNIAYGRLVTTIYDVQREATATETAPVFDASGALVPHHGVLVLHNDQLPGVSSLRTLTLNGVFHDEVATIACTRIESDPLLAFEVDVFDQPLGTELPRIALLPPATSIDEFVDVAAPEVTSLLAAPRIQTGMSDRYARVEAAIGRSPYPSSWNQRRKPHTFHGARRPWAAITSGFVQDVLRGVSAVEIAAPHPPIRPADVFNTWLMEGLYPMIESGGFRPKFRPPVSSIRSVMSSWSDTDAVKTGVRVGLFWNFCGLDAFNQAGGADNMPTTDPNPAVMKANHDGAFDNYRGGIVAAGVSCPTRAQFHATFSVAKDASRRWWGTPLAGFTSTLTQFVAAGFYQHQMAFIANLASFGIDIDPTADLPAAFRYLCYNAGPGRAAATGETWENVDTSQLSPAPRHYINGLRDMTDQPGVWPTLNDWLAKDQIGLGEQSRTAGGARTNAIHFWMLTEEFGIAFPPSIPDF